MSEYQPEHGRPVDPPPASGFPPPPQYPGFQTGQTPSQQPGPAQQYPAPGAQPGGPQPAAGHPGPQTGPQPAQQFPGQYPTGPQQAPGAPQFGGGQPDGGFPGPQTGQQYPGAQPGPQYPTGPQQAPGAPQFGGGQPGGYPGGPQTGPQPAQQFPGPQYQGGPQPGAQPGQYPTGGQPAQGYPGQEQSYQTQGLPQDAAYTQGYPPYQGEYLAGGPGVPPGPPLPAPRKRRRGLWIAVSAGTVVVLGAASVAAYTLLSGSTTTLDKKVPSDVLAYAEVNLDPPAGQKVAAFRYLKHFPDLKVNDNADTLLDGLFDSIFADPDARQKFVQDIQPWLGKHVAVAVDPQGSTPQPVGVIEVKDEGKARSGLADLAKESPFGYVVGDGTVVIAQTQQAAQRAADDAAKSSLSGNSTYRDDVKAAGGNDGVITLWANLGDLTKLLPQGAGANVNVGQLSGTRVAASLHFTDTVADLTLKTFGSKESLGQVVGDRVGKLPDDTAAAVGIGGGDQAIRQGYAALQQAGLTAEIEQSLGDLDLQLPDDLATLVGSQTVLSLAGDQTTPSYGAVTKTDNPSRAAEVAQKLIGKLGNDVPIVQQQTPEGLALASSQDYLAKLVAGNGGLGNTDKFRKAAPDAATSQVVIFVDVQRVLAFAPDAGMPADAKVVQAVGLTAGLQNGTGTMHLRVVVG